MQAHIQFISYYITLLFFQMGSKHRFIRLFCNPMLFCPWSQLSINLAESLTLSLDRTDPKTPFELEPQFDALCTALGLDPNASDVLSVLKTPDKVSWKSITKTIESDSLGNLGTFRGCLSGDWISVDPGPMEWQRCGGLARGLQSHGVRSIVVGDLTEEWYLYSIAHPISGPQDVLPNLERYFTTQLSEDLIKSFPQLPANAGSEESTRLYGEILSCVQVHLPVRLLAKDMESTGYPVLRYEIRWTPEELRPLGQIPFKGLLARIYSSYKFI